MDVSGELHAPAALHGKRAPPTVTVLYKALWSLRAGLDNIKTRKSVISTGNRSPAVQSIASLCTDLGISAYHDIIL
jgi:hypothetical protein